MIFCSPRSRPASQLQTPAPPASSPRSAARFPAAQRPGTGGPGKTVTPTRPPPKGLGVTALRRVHCAGRVSPVGVVCAFCGVCGFAGRAVALRRIHRVPHQGLASGRPSFSHPRARSRFASLRALQPLRTRLGAAAKAPVPASDNRSAATGTRQQDVPAHRRREGPDAHPRACFSCPVPLGLVCSPTGSSGTVQPNGKPPAAPGWLIWQGHRARPCVRLRILESAHSPDCQYEVRKMRVIP